MNRNSQEGNNTTAQGQQEGEGGQKTQTVDLLHALFQPNDVILVRPIETWKDKGNRSRVDFKGIHYGTVASTSAALPRILDRSRTENTNLFFGVCPRFGEKWFEKAWQIRSAAVLWADIDNGGPDDASKRIVDAALPAPSIVVSSGHGVHVYWLLEEAYSIDDIGDPPQIREEWTKVGDQNKKREYLNDDDGQKLYLDQRQNVPALSPKAVQFQDVLSGIAKAIGGDHTTDLSRLLRLPGTLNRKNVRNGDEPKRCDLLELHADRRYAFEEFQRFADQSDHKRKRDLVQAVPLPAPRKPTAAKQDKLAERIIRCQAAEVGERSEADFSLCAFAIRAGVAPDQVWQQVAGVGKFAERGRDYFDQTWEKAANVVRQEILEGQVTSAKTRKSGKTTVAKVIARIFGGAFDFSNGEDVATLKKRLLTPEAALKRVALLDNVKTQRFSWAEFESLVTSEEISGHRLYAGERTRPNTLLWLITLNGPALSRDIAQRVVPIKLARPTYGQAWADDMFSFIEGNRRRIISDIRAEFENEPEELIRATRWASWEREILARLPEPSDAQIVIEERQRDLDVDSEEAGDVEDHFAQRLQSLEYDPEEERVHIPNTITAQWMSEVLHKKFSSTAATRYVKQASGEGQLKRLTVNPARMHGRGILWTGRNPDGGSVRYDLEERLRDNSWK